MDTAEKQRRLMEAAVAVLQGADGHTLKIVLLNKALFYLDLHAYVETGTTLTGATYIALEQGPVVAKYDKRLIRGLADAGLAKQIVAAGVLEKPVVLTAPGIKFSFLNADNLQLAQELGSIFSKVTSTKASVYSHDNPGWLAAWRASGRGKKPLPIDLRIAVQQLVDRDEWLTAPLTDDERAALGGTEGDEEW
ncbi:MAG: SocA family protein [Chloroflexi bacterium]|nr:SocA family protein [Chloroflexota bacterium]